MICYCSSLHNYKVLLRFQFFVFENMELDSYSCLKREINNFPVPRLPTIHQTDWNHYMQLLTAMINPRIPLTTNGEIEQTTKKHYRNHLLSL